MARNAGNLAPCHTSPVITGDHVGVLMFGRKNRQQATDNQRATDDQAQAKADYDALSVVLGRVYCGIDGSGGEYFEPVSAERIATLERFVTTHGNRSANYGTSHAWEGYAYTVSRPDGTADVVANGIVIDQVVGIDTAEKVRAAGGRVPVWCFVDRFGWQSGEWWTVKIKAKPKKDMAKKSLPPPPS